MRIERFGCFGKLPVSREFLLDDARALGESGLDRWIGEGLGLAKARYGSEADRRISTFPSWDFLWCAGRGGRRALYGRLVPGEDGAGRRHPFSVFAWVDGAHPASSTLTSLSSLDEALGRLLEASRAAALPADVLDGVRSAVPPAVADERRATQDLDDWCRTTRAADFWSAMPGGDAPATRFQVLQAFEESVTPLAGRDPSTARYGLRIPVGDGAERNRRAAFWLELLARRLGRPLERGVLLWGGPGDLLVFFGEPTGPQWAALIDPDVELESLEVLARPWGGPPAEARAGEALRRLVDNGEARLSDYLDWARRR